MKYIVFISAALGAILLYLLSLASANTAASGNYYTLLLTLNIGLAAILVTVVSIQLWHLYQKIKKNELGSQLNLRLVSAFALLAIIPGLIVYLVSVNFLSRSIESWFNVKVESALDGGLNLGQRALDIMLNDTKAKAEGMTATLSLQPYRGQLSVLNDLRERSGIQDAALLSLEGRIMAVSSSDPNSFLPELPSIPQLRQSKYRIYGKIEPILNKGLYMRVLAPVSTQDISSEILILQLLQPVPKSLSNTAEAVQEVYRDYQELSFSRNSLKDIFKLTLTLVLMLAMLSSIAIAFVLSRRLSQPITILAEGTRAIAAGDYSTVLPEHGKDELGILVKSFNSMTRQLNDATGASERNRARLEASRSYLETILAHLSSGVLAINPQGELRTHNLVASNILGLSLGHYEGQPLGNVLLKHAYLTEFVKILEKYFEQANTQDDTTPELNRQLEIISPQGKRLLLVRATRLPLTTNRGFVVVFDDITAMAQAQRDAAWGEVARRLAHEIKNPLTPIQLSAERIAHKLTEKLNEEDAAMLKRATKTIVNQVGAMKTMVNEFSEYARAPSAKLVPINLNKLIRDVSGLYDGAQVKIQFELSPDLPELLGDNTMLRQVLHNLMQNAQDALVATAQPQILVKTSFDKQWIRLIVKDNGQGFTEALLPRAYEPYVTSKVHGTGLGLAIVKKIVEEHAGKIRIENNSDGGACVTLQLPIAQVNVA